MFELSPMATFPVHAYRMGFGTYADLSCASDKLLCSLSAKLVQLLI